MPELIVSSLIIAAGLVSVVVGVLMAAQRLRLARRAYAKTAALHAASIGGWDAWFLGGFSSVTMGTQWLSAAVAWLVWTLAGVCLVGLGIRLCIRA